MKGVGIGINIMVFSKGVFQILWSAFTFFLGVYIPKAFGVETYGHFVGIMASIAVVCSIFHSLIIQRVYSVSGSNEFSIISRALQLCAIGFILVVFISLLLLNSTWVSSILFLLYGLSFTMYDISKRLWLLLEKYKYQLLIEIICKWTPLILVVISSVKLPVFLLVITVGNLIYAVIALISVWNIIERPNLLIIEWDKIYTDLVQGTSLLIFNTQASVTSLIYVKAVSYFFGLIEVGAFFALKNLFLVTSPLSQFTEVSLSRSLVKSRHPLKHVFYWIFFLMMLTVVLSVLFVFLREDIFLYLNLSGVSQSTLYGFMFVLLFASGVELINKPLIIYLRFLRMFKHIGRMGLTSFIVAMVGMVLFFKVFQVENMGWPLVLNQGVICLTAIFIIGIHEGIIDRFKRVGGE